MIYCSCNKISNEKIKDYLTSLPTNANIPSVGTVIKALGYQASCGICAATIAKTVKEHFKDK